MSVPTAETILTDLRRIPLLTPSQLKRVEEAAARGSHSPDRVVARLAEKGWVTRFQADTLLAGKAATLVVGPYVLLDLLGEGGMGRVYKARHVRLGRVDAVKVIRADRLASKTLARRFAREIRLTAILDHPHIVRALDAGEAGGRLYLATEFVDGEDLGTVVTATGPLSPADACLAAYQTCLALQCVHARGLVHRDVKPSNLMRERATRAIKLMDLGLSAARTANPGASMAAALTADGVMLGTPDFMPPEQAQNPHGADIRADLYGLGCTLYCLLTGHPPYGGSPIEKLLSHATAPVPPVVTPTGPAPAALAAIVSRLMAKKPEDRFPTPVAVAEALLALRPGVPSVAMLAPPAGDFSSSPDPRPSAPAEAWQTEFGELVDLNASRSQPTRKVSPARGPRWVRPAIAVAGGLAVLVAGVLIGRSRKPGSHADPPPTQAPQVQTLQTPAEELRELKSAAAAHVADETVRRRVIEFRARHAGSPLATAAAAVLGKLPSPLDRVAVDDKAVVRAAGAGPPVGGLAFAADDSRLVVARTGKPPEELALPDLTPTGRFAAAAVAGHSPALTPGGRTAAVVDPAGHVIVWGPGGVRTLEIPGLSVRVVGLMPDGKGAVVVPADPDAAVARVDLVTGKVLGRLDVRAVGIRDVAVAADGSACLLPSDDGTAHIAPLPAGSPVRTIEPFPDMPGPAVGAFAPDGVRLYIAGIEHAPGRYPAGASRSDLRYELPPEGRPSLWRLGPRTPRVSALAVSPDEAAVAVGTPTGRLAVFASGTGKQTADLTLPGGVTALAFSTHGRALAAALDGGRVVLIPLGK